MTSREGEAVASFDGTELAIHRLGAGRPVLLLHGLFSSAEMNWIRFGHAARVAEANGFTAIFSPMFAGLPEGSLAKGAEIAGVTPVSLGAGYATFFVYSVVIGVIAVILAFFIARKQPEIDRRIEEREAKAVTEAQPS